MLSQVIIEINYYEIKNINFGNHKYYSSNYYMLIWLIFSFNFLQTILNQFQIHIINIIKNKTFDLIENAKN